MSKNIFNDLSNLGPILTNISNQIVNNESVLTLLPNNQVLNLPISTFGKALLDSTSLADLRSQILENTNEEAIRLTADSQNEINFYTGGTTASNLRLQIKDGDTFVNNVLNSNVVKTAAVRSNQGDNSTLVQSTDGSTNIRFVPQNATISYLQNYGVLAFTKIGEGNSLLAIDHTDNNKIVYTNAEFNINVAATDNTFCLYKCPGGEQVSLYSHSGLKEGFLIQKAANDDGVKINMFHSGYRPIYLNSANNSKLVIGSEVIQSDSEKLIVASTSRFKDYVVCDDSIKLSGPNNSGALYCRGDINLGNTNLDAVCLNYNISVNPATNVESVILPGEKTAQILMNQFTTQFRMSSVNGALPSTILEVNEINVVTFKNFIPDVTDTIDLGVDDGPGNLIKRFSNCYLNQDLDIDGTSSRVIMTDSSITDNTIRDSGVCGNTIVGIKSKNTDTGVGFLRLSAGIETTQQINETYIDLYGANSTDTYQSIRHIVNNSEIFVIDTNTAEFKQSLYTKSIFPSSAPTTNPHTDSLYDIGADTRRYRDIYTRDAPTHGSDMRLKKNIVPLENSLNTILKLQPKLFQWISSSSGRNHIGFIAQHIEQIPELANTGYFCKSKDGATMSLRSSELIPVLTGAIQDLYGIITSSTDKKPVIIKEQHSTGVQEHKCNNYDLLNQLNSYEVQLLENENKLNKMDKFLEEVIEDKEKLEVNNKLQDLRIIELEKNNLLLNEKINDLLDKKSDLMTEDDEGESMFDIMNKRMIELENRLIKTETKNKKLTSVINKLIKEK